MSEFEYRVPKIGIYEVHIPEGDSVLDALLKERDLWKAEALAAKAVIVYAITDVNDPAFKQWLEARKATDAALAPKE